MSLIPWRSKTRATELGEPGDQTMLQRFRDEIDRTFERFFRDPWSPFETGLGSVGTWGPAVEMSESDDEVTVRAEIPGMEPKDLDITVEGSRLILSGEKQESSEKKGRDCAYSECRYGSFRRVIELPSSTDPTKVTATHKNGVLTIRIEKSPSEKPKRIKLMPAK